MSKKPSLGSLLLAGAAAYGLYKVSKMSSQERTDLLNSKVKKTSSKAPVSNIPSKKSEVKN